MTWTKLDDGIFDHPKMVKAGEDAANLYVRALVYCNRYLTDGRVEVEVLPVLTRKRDAAKLAEALVRVGAWESHPDGGWLVHGFHEHNPTAEEVEARRAEISRKRSEAGKRGGLRSGEVRSNEANVKQDASRESKQNEASAKQPDEANAKPRPVPSRPDPAEDISSPAAVAPSALPAQATLDLGAPKPAKPPRAKKAADPPPFGIGAAFEALASSAGGRFAPGVEGDWVKGVRIAVAKSVRQYPDLGAWRLVGEWLAAGGDRFRGVLGPSWAASGALADTMARAREWDATGRPALAGSPATFGQTPSQARAEPDIWTRAAAKQGVVL